MSTVVDFGDAAVQRRNKEAGHTLCKRCEGTGNELFAMYRHCQECGGSGIAVEYGELSSTGRWWVEARERREHRRREREYRPPRDWNLEIAWRLSRWLGIGQCFHASKDACHRCGTWPIDVDYAMRRIGPFRCECLDRSECDATRAEYETQPDSKEER